MKIVAVCSREPAPHETYYRPDVFIESCRRFNCEPIILKEGYGGLGSKLRLLKEFLDTGIIEAGIMIFCDSFDLVFQRDPNEAETLFMERATDNATGLVFNAERNLFPFNEEVEQGHPLSETTYKYLNSGFIIGWSNVFRECLNLMNADKIPDDHQLSDGRWIHPNDQEIWQRLFAAHRKSLHLALDTRVELCQTLSDVLPEELDFDGPMIGNRETGTTPVALHLNGSKEQWWPIILKHLKLG